jgi:hypothetical protein
MLTKNSIPVRAAKVAALRTTVPGQRGENRFRPRDKQWRLLALLRVLPVAGLPEIVNPSRLTAGNSREEA